MKMTAGSPFHPTFGSSPPEFSGREAVIDAVTTALDDGAGSADRRAVIVGARGIGKTVTLNAIEDAAAARGWIIISETVTPGLNTRLLTERIPAAAGELRSPSGRRLTGVTLPAGLGGISLSEPAPPLSAGLRDALAELVTLARARGGSGLLITLDEVHGKGGRAELIELAAQLQHLLRRDVDIAFAAAGLPAAVNDVLNEDVATFLYRATRFHLAPLTKPETEDALQVPIESEGRTIESDALASAVQASVGYPYLIQSIGDLAWKRTPPDQPITRAEVAWAVRRAVASLGLQVHGPALHDLSPRDREFLVAMATDEGPSRISDVADRMGRKLPYVSQYRARLLAAEIIRPAGHGMVEFALPYLREYLRDTTV
jgi:hypothetical protein